MSELLKRLRARHVDYTGPLGESWWKLVRAAFEGSGGFRVAVDTASVDDPAQEDWTGVTMTPVAGSYLRRYPRESGTAFAQRQRTSHYRNHIKTIVAQYQGHLWRRPPQRETSMEVLRAWWSSVDGVGTAIDPWLAVGCRRAQLFGWAVAYTDRPSTGVTLADAHTTARWLQPEELVDWELDGAGRFVWARLCTYVSTRDPFTGVCTVEEQYTTWTRTEWQRAIVRDGVVEAGERVPHTLGAVPLEVLYWSRPEGGRLYGTSHLDSAIGAALELFNVASEAREVERGTAFPVLYVQVQTQGTLASARLGSNNGLEIEPGVNIPPGFVSPDASISEHYAARRTELRDEIYQSANLDPPQALQSGGAESGVALARRFLPRRSVLVDATASLADFEGRMVELIARWWGATDATQISTWRTGTRIAYATDFDVDDTDTAIDRGLRIVGAGSSLAPVTLRAARIAVGRAIAPQATPTDDAALIEQATALYQRDCAALPTAPTAPTKPTTPGASP